MSSYTVDGQTRAADERSDESSQGARVGARHNAREFVQEGVIERQRVSAREEALPIKCLPAIKYQVQLKTTRFRPRYRLRYWFFVLD